MSEKTPSTSTEISSPTQVEKAGFEDGFVSEFPEYDEYGLQLRKVVEEKILTEEEKEVFFRTLEFRFKFENNPLKEFHRKLDWNKVKESLEADEKALLKVYKMEEVGHEPDIYDFDGSGFSVGTCSIDSPSNQRDCTYQESVEMANKIGIDHMNMGQYKKLQRNGGYKFDKKTWSWLKAPKILMDPESGPVLVGAIYSGAVSVYQARPEEKGKLGSWRGTFTVNWKV